MCRMPISCLLGLLAIPVASLCSAVLGAEPDADLRTVVTGSNRFALELYGKLRSADGNLFFSPYSVSTALAMTYGGARGETAIQMAKVLHFDLPADRLHPALGSLVRDLNEGGKKEAYQLSVANALWGPKETVFLKNYLELAEKYYGGALQTVDFAGATEAARQTINGWVEEHTAQKIKDLIPGGVLTPSTHLVLTNAIYFKGNWAAQFKKERSKDEPFTLADGSKVDAPLMHQTGKFKYAEDPEWQMLEMPYAGEDVVMTVLLPRKLDGLAALERNLTADNLAAWLAKLAKREVDVTLPKFKVTSASRLDEPLKALGMTAAFGAADFSGMTGKRDFTIGAVLHKAFVDVNEEGTEAAGATAVVMLRTSVVPSPTPVFRADHPFVFLIRHAKSDSILFVGRLMNPKA